jgi:hypothetical protein
MFNDFGVKFLKIGVRIAFQNQTKTVVKRAGLKKNSLQINELQGIEEN